jgi:tryptophanyl-tRNA synthetase
MKEFDLFAGTRNNSNAHTLLGQNQHHLRNLGSIKMSSSSPAINIYRNNETNAVLKEITKTMYSKAQIGHIQECLRSFNIELQHLMPLKSAFIKCD